MAVGVLAIEFGVRAFEAYVASRDVQPKGMFARDASLGWRLTPKWRGHHSHYDFELDYATNQHGFRGEFGPLPKFNERSRYAVVGDSITYGMGSADADTFVERLNDLAGSKAKFLNYGVPGYSTDREVLLIEREVVFF